MVDLVVLDPLSSDGWKPTHKIKAVVGDVDTGSSKRVQQWVDPIRFYAIPFENRTLERWTAMRDFHILRGGVVRGFLLWDIYSCFAQNQPIGVGNGTSKTFQLSTTISDAANSYTRTIGYPVPAGTDLPINVAALVNGLYGTAFTQAAVTVTVGGVARNDFTVSRTTGALTFTGAAPANGAAVLATFFYFTPVRFQNQDWDMTLNGVYGSTTPPLVELINE